MMMASWRIPIVPEASKLVYAWLKFDAAQTSFFQFEFSIPLYSGAARGVVVAFIFP
jgi:hypothetical protein